MVVNGKEHFVGSDASKMNEAIKEYRKLKAAKKVELSEITADKNGISFEYEILGEINNRTLRAVLVLDQRTTKVKRGENRNRTLINSNIVVAEKSIKIEDNIGNSFMAIPEIVYPGEGLSLIVLAENREHDITGAAKAEVAR